MLHIFGTECHSVMELLWNKKNYNYNKKLNESFDVMEEDFNYRKKEVCIPLFNKMKKVFVPIATEFIVYDQPNALCGTIDFLAYKPSTQSYVIIDWKTSKKFDKGNHFGKYLKAPFDNFEECNTAKYSLQLSLYKTILERHTSIRISEMLLFQIPGKDNPIPEMYKCIDFSKQINEILK